MPHRREVIFFIPTGASTQCNEAIVYKYPSPGDAQGVPRWSRRTSNGAGFKLSSGVLMHKTFYSGSYTGFVNTMFTSSSYDGIEIPFKYEYPYWDGSNERQIKRVLDAFIHLKIRESTSITLKSQWLGGGNNDSLSVPYQVQSSQSGARYGVAVYGADRYAAVELDTKVKCHIPGNGERLKFTISGTNNTSGIDFMGLTFFVESGNLSHHWN